MRILVGSACLGLTLLAGSPDRVRADETLDRLEEMLGRMDGLWLGKDLRLEVAGAAYRARLDDKQWEALQVRNIAGDMVTFSLGTQILFALVRPDRIEVTRYGVQGAETLRRPGAKAGAPTPKPSEATLPAKAR